MTNKVTAVVEKREIHVVAVGQQGPPGIQGPAGPAGASVTTYVAGEALGGNRAVKADASGQAVYATNTDAASQHLLGVTTGAASAAANVGVQRAGVMVEPSWSWTPNQPVFLGVNGVLTQTYPTGALLSIIVGFALTPTSIHLSPREPVITA